jgi:hypothetical protein
MWAGRSARSSSEDDTCLGRPHIYQQQSFVGANAPSFAFPSRSMMRSGAEKYTSPVGDSIQATAGLQKLMKNGPKSVSKQ